MINETTLRTALSAVIDPYLSMALGDSAIKTLTSTHQELQGLIERPYPCARRTEALNFAVQQALSAFDIKKINLQWMSKILPHKAQRGIPLLHNIRNIVAVASGKGGVGKSTTTVNVALAMAQEGARVGILDADIYGPSMPQMLGLAGQKPHANEKNQLTPLTNHGVQAMSIGFMIDVETPMVWRGPMVSQALDQLLRDTAWDDLDFLFVDMPPGTGDIQLTLSQKVPLTGAVIVTTPQDIALLDARKGLKMFEKVNVPILGLVENMSLFCCPQCGHREPIFGEGGAEKMSADYRVPVLGQLPLTSSIRLQADNGAPTTIAEPDSAIAQIYRDIAHSIALGVAKMNQSFDRKMPNIVIQNT